MAQRTRTAIGVASGVPNSGTGTVPELTSFLSDDPVSATWTPAATSHTALDSVGGAQTFTGVGQSGTMVMIVGATFSIDTTTPVASAFRLHLYNATPAVIADDATYVVVTADGSKYLGYIDLGTAVDLGSTWQFVAQDGLAKPVKLVDTTIVAYLQNITTVTLEAVAHKVTLFTVPLS